MLKDMHSMIKDMHSRDGEKECIVVEESEKILDNVEDILCAIKPYGRFQLILNIMLCMVIAPPSFVTWITYFTTTDVPWRCSANSTRCLYNGTFTQVTDDLCAMDRKEWEFVQGPKTSIKLYFDLYCDNEWAVHMASSSLFLGWALGSFFISYLADEYGRKIVVFPSSLVISVVGFLCIFSPNIQAFIVFRFIIGLVISGNFHILFIVMGEFVDNKHRPFSISLITVANAIWSCILCLKAYFIRDWKLLTIATTLPYMVIIFFYKFVPETMHWLHLHGRQKEMISVLERMCYWNNVTIPENIKTVEVNSQFKKPRSSLLELFRTPSLRNRTIRLLYAWFTVGVVYFSISMASSDLTGSFYRDFLIIMAIEIPSNVICVYCCGRFGRKNTITSNMMIASIACLAIAIIPDTGEVSVLRLVLGVFGKLCITVVFNAFFSWTMELYGTDVRANIMGIANVAARIGGASSPWIAKALKHINKSTPFLVMGSLGILGGCVMFTFPETKDSELKTVSLKSTSSESNEENQVLYLHEQQ